MWEAGRCVLQALLRWSSGGTVLSYVNENVTGRPLTVLLQHSSERSENKDHLVFPQHTPESEHMSVTVQRDSSFMSSLR